MPVPISLAGIDPESIARLDKIRTTIGQAEVILQKLLKNVGLENLDPDALRRLIAQRPQQKALILSHITKAQKITQMRRKTLQKQTDLIDQIHQTSRQARVEVADAIYPQVAVQIGSEKQIMQEGLKGVCLCTDPEGDKAGICWQPLNSASGKEQDLNAVGAAPDTSK